jgi:hypothetical protein
MLGALAFAMHGAALHLAASGHLLAAWATVARRRRAGARVRRMLSVLSVAGLLGMIRMLGMGDRGRRLSSGWSGHAGQGQRGEQYGHWKFS